jgi:hypothetical protein
MPVVITDNGACPLRTKDSESDTLQLRIHNAMDRSGNKQTTISRFWVRHLVIYELGFI